MRDVQQAGVESAGAVRPSSHRYQGLHPGSLVKHGQPNNPVSVTYEQGDHQQLGLTVPSKRAERL